MSEVSAQISHWLEDRARRLARQGSGRVEQRLNRLAFNWKVRSALYRHMAVQVDNGVNQISALEGFKRRLEREKRKSCIYVVNDLVRRMKNGAQLSGAMRQWVPGDEALTITGAEMAGNIGAAFELLLQSKERTANVRRAMVSAFTTPMVYLCAIYGMLWAIGMYFLPSIQQAMPSGKAQGLGALLYSMGDFATSYWVLLPIGLIIAGVVWIFWALPNWTSRYRIPAEKFFPFNFYRDIQGYVWLLTFASMLQAGMSDTKILLDQSRLASPWLHQRLLAVRRRMVNGEALAGALQKAKFEFPSPEMIDDIASMADFDDFPARIMKRTVQWADDLERIVKARIRTLGFVFDMVMYGLILLVLLGMNSLSVQMGSVPGMS